MLHPIQVWEQSPGGADTSFFDTIWGAIDEVGCSFDRFLDYSGQAW